MARTAPERKPPSQRRGPQPERRRPAPEIDLSDPNGIYFVAIHEAGHAVHAALTGFDLKGVDIKRRPHPDGGTSLGWTDSGKLSFSEVTALGEQGVKRHVVQSMAGPIAEQMVNPEGSSNGSYRGDWNDASQLAKVAICTPKKLGGQSIIDEDEIRRCRPTIARLIDESIDEATEFVAEHWPAITAVARLLIERKSLTGAEVAAIARTAPLVRPDPADISIAR